MVGMEPSTYHGKFVLILLDGGSHLGMESSLFEEVFI